MATYRPSFVDVSGLTQGISQGLEASYLLKKQEDALAESKVDEYLKNYRPDKLRDGDIGAFTGVYNDYKKAALEYSRMNRGGAKPEQLTIAKSNMDKALSGLNNVYTNSAKMSNKAAEYGDYIKRARLAGLNIPKEILDNYDRLTSGNVRDTNVDAIPPAYSFELIKKNADLQKLDYILNNFGATPTTETVSQKVKVGTLGGKDIFAEDKYTITSRPVEPTIKAVRVAMGEDNAMKRDAETLYEIFKQDPYSNMKELQKVAPNLSYENVDPATLYAMQYFMPKLSSKKRDNTSANMQINAIKFDTDENYKKATLALRTRQVQNMENRVKDENRNLIDPAKDLTDFENANKGKKGWIKVPNTKAYQWTSKYSFQKANVEDMEYNPELQQYRVKTSVNKSPELYSSKEAKAIATSNTKGSTNKPYDGYIPNEDQLRSTGYDIDADPELKSLLNNLDFGSNDQEDENQ
jgi:hypothetical protein